MFKGLQNECTGSFSCVRAYSAIYNDREVAILIEIFVKEKFPGMFEAVESSKPRICTLAKTRNEVCIGPDLGNRNNVPQPLSTRV